MVPLGTLYFGFCIINTAIFARGKERYFFSKLNAFLHSEFLDPRNLIQISSAERSQLVSLKAHSKAEANTNTPEQAQETTWFPVKHHG